DWLGELNALGRQLLDRFFDVVAHEVQLVAPGFRRVNRMHAQLRRRQRKDQPPATRVDRRKPQHISKKRAHSVRVVAENNRVSSSNQRSSSLNAKEFGHLHLSSNVFGAELREIDW